MIIFNEVALKVLDENQLKLKPLLDEFSKSYFLAGGTAIALQLGHRKSIDFDFFSSSQITFADFYKIINSYGFDVSSDDKKYYSGIEFEKQDEIHVNISGVKLSLINYFRTLYNDQQKIYLEMKLY